MTLIFLYNERLYYEIARLEGTIGNFLSCRTKPYFIRTSPIFVVFEPKMIT